ncbi:hypothetical protein ACQKM2_22115 [Streptomyces sp. NPDC004126]|uniref:hypothetical protein n=1 Tax=Streptomyces sp. NPDC004126 TaxID=3390695 RepID=UPI003D0612F3
MSDSTAPEYGLASDSLDDIEPLGRISPRRAKAVWEDSRRQWPDVYLVQRDAQEPWRRTAS